MKATFRKGKDAALFCLMLIKDISSEKQKCKGRNLIGVATILAVDSAF